MSVKLVLPALLTLLGQRFLGMPGLPRWSADLVLPVIWLVAAALLRKERPWPLEALLLGLAWDALMAPVIGPGGIAWTAAALTLNQLATVVADRSPKAWAGFGAVGALAVVMVHQLAMLPLGFELSATLPQLLRTALLSGGWCGAVGIVLGLDLPQRWRVLRARKLR